MAERLALPSGALSTEGTRLQQGRTFSEIQSDSLLGIR